MTKQKLPTGIKATDLKYPTKAPWPIRTFDLWYTEAMGWVIPTLKIGGGRGANGHRTYAVKVSDKGICRVGNGPHVKEMHTVYVTEKNKDRLQPFLDLMTEGEAGAGTIRDRISTRRAQGAVNRAKGMTRWYW